MPDQYVIIQSQYGAVDVVVGPFDGYTLAFEYAEANLGIGVPWEVVRLLSPAALGAQEDREADAEAEAIRRAERHL